MWAPWHGRRGRGTCLAFPLGVMEWCKVGWGAGCRASSSPRAAGALSGFLLERSCCSERGSQPPAHSSPLPEASPLCSGRNALTHRPHLIPGGCRDAELPPERIRVPLLPQPHSEGKIQSVLSLSSFPWPHKLTLPTSPGKGPEGEGLDGSGINAQLPHGQWHHLLLMSWNNIVNTHWEIIISYKRSSSLWFEPGLVSNTCFY